jgi:TonB family protein
MQSAPRLQQYSKAPDPVLAAVLSVVPGCGQIYNGDRRKGILFLTATVLSLIPLAVCIFNQSHSRRAIAVINSFHLKVDTRVLNSLQLVGSSSPQFFVLLGLFTAFVAFSMFDAYKRADSLSRAQYVPSFDLETSEATSGSYIAHSMLAAICLVYCIAFCAPLRQIPQTVDIEFEQSTASSRSRSSPMSDSKLPIPLLSTSTMHPKPIAVPPSALSTADAAPSHILANSRRSTHRPDVVSNRLEAKSTLGTHTPESALAMVEAMDERMESQSTTLSSASLKSLSGTERPSWLLRNTEGVRWSGTSVPPVAVRNSGAVSENFHIHGSTPALGGTDANLSPQEHSMPGATETAAAAAAAEVSDVHMPSAHPDENTAGDNPLPNGEELLMAMAAPMRQAESNLLPSLANPKTFNEMISDSDSNLSPSMAAEKGRAEYMEHVRRRVAVWWFNSQSYLTPPVDVAFKIHNDGSISKLAVTKSSGSTFSDQEVLRAIRRATPFVAVPFSHDGDIDIEMTIDDNIVRPSLYRIDWGPITGVFKKFTDASANWGLTGSSTPPASGISASAGHSPLFHRLVKPSNRTSIKIGSGDGNFVLIEAASNGGLVAVGGSGVGNTGGTMTLAPKSESESLIVRSTTMADDILVGAGQTATIVTENGSEFGLVMVRKQPIDRDKKLPSSEIITPRTQAATHALMDSESYGN